MSLSLRDYARELQDIPDYIELLERVWLDATRIFTAHGLGVYLQDVYALHQLGKGDDLVQAYITQGPPLARELGEDAAHELVSALLQMASRTSGTVLLLVVETSLTAAVRLGDQQLFSSYLQLLNYLLAQAPRGVRPMLGQLDILLGQLTLGGLRRWATWGAQAYRTDFTEQAAYFALESRTAQAVLQKERKGTLFVDVQRRIQIYLRALWGRDFFMRPTSGDLETRQGLQPYIEGYFMCLPDACDDVEGISGVEVYRAIAAHCAAHIVYTRHATELGHLTPLQRVVVELVEDARVEALAIQTFPGIKNLWLKLHRCMPKPASATAELWHRLALALLDEQYQDAHPWVMLGQRRFAEVQTRLQQADLALQLGYALAAELPPVDFHPRHDQSAILYRDDNRYFREYTGLQILYDTAELRAKPPTRQYVSLMEMINETDTELAGDSADIWVLRTELFPYEDMGVSFNDMEGQEPVSEPYYYSEWDYQAQLERPNWVTVLERRAAFGEVRVVENIVAQHQPLVARMKYLLDAMQPQGVQRVRKLEEGDELDLNALVMSACDRRIGLFPDDRVMMRNLRQVRDISVTVLLDLSESTNEKVAGQDYTVLDLTRQATVLLAEALHKVGDPFSIHGFASNGRHDLQYYCFKHFTQPYREEVKMRLAGMSGKLSTRMGTAIRHAGYYLAQQKSAKKLLLVLTDGEPADVDVRDPQYLRHDAKKAVETLRRNGILTYCISLDPHADDYVSRIFGMRNYMVVDHVECLPEKLPFLYAGLTR